MRTKITREHIPNCYSIKNVNNGTWNTSWYYKGGYVYRRKNGSRTGPKQTGERWLEMECNCHYCPAAIIVNENDILELLPNA